MASPANAWSALHLAHGEEPPDGAPARLNATVRTLQWGQHALTVALLLIGAARSLAGGAEPLLLVPAAVLFLGWYAAGAMLPRSRRDPLEQSAEPAAGHRAQWWLLGLAVCWALLCLISAENVWLAFPLWLLAGHLLPLRGGLVFSALVLAVVVLRPVQQGATTYAAVIGPAVGAIFALGISHAQLKLVRDAQDRQRLVRSLVAAQEEMAELHDELARTQRESGALSERTRLSRDIHDTIAQGLSSIVLLSRAGLGDRPAGEPAAPEESADRHRRLLAQIEATAAENLVEARRIVGSLAPAALDEEGLGAALSRLLDRLGEESGIETALHTGGDLPALPMAAEVTLLRSAQSALANVRQHARASTVVLTLARAEDTVRLDVVDDGVGFDVPDWEQNAHQPPVRGGYGLRSMRARLRELGGGLDVESRPGEGCAISAHLPLGRELSEPG